MFIALDANPERLDQHEQKFVQRIREHGWLGTHVMPDDNGPGFSYTTGFWLKFGFPEVILFSMSRDNAHDTFWTIDRGLEAGRRFPVGEPTDEIFENIAAVLLPVSPTQYASHLGWSRWFYGNDNFECLQLVFPDRGGEFPWTPGSSADFRAAQPDLTLVIGPACASATIDFAWRVNQQHGWWAKVRLCRVHHQWGYSAPSVILRCAIAHRGMTGELPDEAEQELQV